jgi:DNA-binding transcriptional ArsR family regulator
MQKESIHLTNPEAAQTLRNSAVLQFFLEPVSPSDVAKRSGLAANLVHHHAKKALELGLLLESKRENGKVFYQLAARQFTYARDLLPFEQKEPEDMRLITNAFLEAYQKSDALFRGEDAYVLTHGFVTAEDPQPAIKSKHNVSLEKHPAYFLARTFNLGQARYQQLVNDISRLIEEAVSETTKDSSSCSLVFMGFDGQWREGQSQSDTININGFVPNN